MTTLLLSLIFQHFGNDDVSYAVSNKITFFIRGQNFSLEMNQLFVDSKEVKGGNEVLFWRIRAGLSALFFPQIPLHYHGA
jgi:hypothetical protein